MIWNLWLRARTEVQLIIEETELIVPRTVSSTKFVRICYTEAVAVLEEVLKERQFENIVEWGIDLASEHERYLTEVKFKSLVIVYDYLKGIKAFYMKVNPDDKTVAAMDVLVPKV
ncbi:hypothetical protein RHMOL_Rhmol01G0040200 [Rhododendron molle]|uniref:Uncharacterized protein n=1 Tax=Rhododendron molle TaxID=49168 RepID=A0ACC0PZC2_RHOML|nr:hypothetical protein RHMOL_Rhmol01G0040200 [Rhododendron molle]